MKKIILYAVTHKYLDKKIDDREYIFVGPEAKTPYLSDKIGDNISSKNQYFCELTAIYWIWKNSYADIVGIEHYRRIFGFNLFNFKNSFAIKKTKIEKMLNKYDVILPKKTKFDKTILERYKENLDKKDFDFVRQIINKKYPDYVFTFDKVLNSKKAGMCNMLICNKKIFDSYCNWLFDILFELEKIINPAERIGYRKRVFGYISERLLDVWIEKNNYKVIRKPILRLDKGKIMTLLRLIKSTLNFPLKGNPMEKNKK